VTIAKEQRPGIGDLAGRRHWRDKGGGLSALKLACNSGDASARCWSLRGMLRIAVSASKLNCAAAGRELLRFRAGFAACQSANRR
jgi:hypothetical protein